MKHISKIIIISIIIFVPQLLSAQSGLSIEAKIDSLIDKMTLKEKIGQMNQLSAGDMETNYKLAKEGLAGSILSIPGPKVANKAQKIAVEESRLGIPILYGRDVIHGYKTIFPIPLGLAATFDPDLVEEAARIAAIEASATGIRWTFAPMLDITVDPRWGRIAESIGEDPYLGEQMAKAYIRGFQTADLANSTAIAACAKHFAGYGGAEGGRDYNSTFFTERQFRNKILRPFKAAVDEGAATIMTAFNDNDGIPSSANKWLLKDILREEWKFDGFVVSDWASITEMITHGYSANRKEAALAAIKAGVDMEMVSGTYIEFVEDLVKEGRITEEEIDSMVRNILRIKFKLGLFDNPYTDESRVSVFYDRAHLEAAKVSVEKSVILLKNVAKTLPLDASKIKKLAVFGPLADAPHDQLGTWVFDGDKNYTQTPIKAIKQMYSEQMEILYEPVLTHARDKDISLINTAVNKAKEADAIVVFVGEEAIMSGEAHSLTNLNLVGVQALLIEELSKLEIPLITVIIAGRPLTIQKQLDESDVLLYSFAPGTMGGPAIRDILFGNTIPSGRTPVTFPKVVGQIPIYYNHRNTGRPANGQEILLDDIPKEASQTSLGNRSYYLDAGHKPLFPFGYGLSYTTFNYANLKLNSIKINIDEVLKLSVHINNTGGYDAEEVVQLYIQDIYASVTRPVKELKAFKRVFIKKGESVKIQFTITKEDLAFWNTNNEFKAEPGIFNVWIGPNSEEGLKASFELLND